MRDGFRKTDLGIDLIANHRLSEGRCKTQDYFRYFLHLFSVPSLSSKNERELILAYPQKIV